jgi:hypothetical protein
MRIIPFRLAAATLLGLPCAALAQGTLSTQGFGYPSGQISARALGTGGALAEIDPLSVTNPSSLLNMGGSALYFQAEPEYRTITAGGQSERSTIARYPLVAAMVPLTPSLFAGLSVSTLLDRSFETRSRGAQVLPDGALPVTNVFKSDGSIGDLRLAIAWAPRPWLHLGVAGHAISGDNRLRSTQTFDDSTRFAPLTDTTTLGYVGNAYSTGLAVYTGNAGVLTASYRRGGHLSLKHGDTTKSEARVPDRLALSAAYLGIRGTSIAVRTARDQWSDMRGLGSSRLRVAEGWDTSVGADVLGPRFAGLALQLRAGARWRTLPFGIATSDVRERSYAFGLGTLLARGRAAVDVAGIRATRDASGSPAQESAWTLSFGLTVRP